MLGTVPLLSSLPVNSPISKKVSITSLSFITAIPHGGARASRSCVFVRGSCFMAKPLLSTKDDGEKNLGVFHGVTSLQVWVKAWGTQKIFQRDYSRSPPSPKRRFSVSFWKSTDRNQAKNQHLMWTANVVAQVNCVSFLFFKCMFSEAIFTSQISRKATHIP